MDPDRIDRIQDPGIRAFADIFQQQSERLAADIFDQQDPDELVRRLGFDPSSRALRLGMSSISGVLGDLIGETERAGQRLSHADMAILIEVVLAFAAGQNQIHRLARLPCLVACCGEEAADYAAATVLIVSAAVDATLVAHEEGFEATALNRRQLEAARGMLELVSFALFSAVAMAMDVSTVQQQVAADLAAVGLKEP